LLGVQYMNNNKSGRSTLIKMEHNF
jgi:hypothetical protein